MGTLTIDAKVPELSPAEGLAGWRREFCVELLGDGAARVYIRKVEQSSFKAAELQRATLFHRLPPTLTDLPRCIESLGPYLHALVDSAKRMRPGRDNLFSAATYDRSAWEQLQQRIDQWDRGPRT